MTETSDNLLALAYRIAYGVAGSWLTARLAPFAPMRHALILGGIGLVVSLTGVVGAMHMDLGPLWYPVLVALSALPCAWVGGRLARR
jgi:hypothetical protein